MGAFVVRTESGTFCSTHVPTQNSPAMALFPWLCSRWQPQSAWLQLLLGEFSPEPHPDNGKRTCLSFGPCPRLRNKPWLSHRNAQNTQNTR